MIDINNYEEYVLDYLEGALSNDEHQEMASFLSVNPLIKEEISDLLDFSLPTDETIVFDNKKTLKKSRGYMYWMLAALIGIMMIGYGMKGRKEGQITIPNNKIEKYQTPQPIENKVGKEYVIGEPNKNIEEENVIGEQKNTMALDLVESKGAKTSQVKTTGSRGIKEADSNTINVNTIPSRKKVNEKPFKSNRENLGSESMVTIEHKPQILVENGADGREKKAYAKLVSIVSTVELASIKSIDIDDILVRDRLKPEDDQAIVINVKLGRFAKTKNKIKTFLEKEAFVAVRDAITPEYFAKN